MRKQQEREKKNTSYGPPALPWGDPLLWFCSCISLNELTGGHPSGINGDFTTRVMQLVGQKKEKE